MDLLRALSAATDEFGRRVSLVPSDGWTQRTPCDDWDVHYLTAHVVGGNRFAVALLGGMTSAAAIDDVMSTSQLGDDPVAAWDHTAAAQLDAFQATNALDRRVDHPLGAISGREFLEFRIFDITLHAWDLARSIDVDEHLDDDLVEVVLDIIDRGPSGMGFDIVALGEANDLASRQTRLLDLAGRR